MNRIPSSFDGCCTLVSTKKMDYSPNSPTRIIATLCLIIAAILLLSSSPWEPLAYKNSFFPQKNSSKTLNHTESARKDELELALERAAMAGKTVIIAVINKAYVEPNKDEYPSMFDLFLEGFWAGNGTRPLLDHLVVVSMDATAHERCRFRRLNCYRLDGGGDGFAGEKIYMSKEFIEMMWRRTSFLVQVLNKGYSFIFTDTDVLWLRNPFTRLLTIENSSSIDLQISTDAFNGDASSQLNPMNTGFYFIRASNRTTALFQRWYDSRNASRGMKEQDVMVKLVRNGVLRELGINARFLDTRYFSGFCRDSDDARSVVTVHANCCRSIKAKVVDLKAVLKDWKRFKEVGSGVNGSVISTNSTSNIFRWSRHIACMNSWRKGVVY